MEPSKAEHSLVDLVVIGRNSIETLTQIYGDPRYLTFLRVFFQACIYVDSHSTDGSRGYMERMGFRGISLRPGERPCASAGRAAGAGVASSPFILFLDGDMALEAPDSFASAWPVMQARLDGNPGLAGTAAGITDIYPGGGKRARRFPTAPDGTARAFGGAVLLKRATLEAMGGWNPDILAQEELELHTRLAAAGKRLLTWPAFQVCHHTWVTSPVSELMGAYIPTRGRTFGGAGMAARAAWQGGRFWSFLRLMPEPFLLLLTLIVGLPMLRISPVAALVISTTYALWVTRRRSLAFNAVVPGVLISVLWGWMRYRTTPDPVHQDSNR